MTTERHFFRSAEFIEFQSQIHSHKYLFDHSLCSTDTGKETLLLKLFHISLDGCSDQLRITYNIENMEICICFFVVVFVFFLLQTHSSLYVLTFVLNIWRRHYLLLLSNEV